MDKRQLFSHQELWKLSSHSKFVDVAGLNTQPSVKSKKACAILPLLRVMTAHNPVEPGDDVAYRDCITSPAPLEPSIDDDAIWACVASWEMPFTPSVAFDVPEKEIWFTYAIDANSDVVAIYVPVLWAPTLS